MRNRQNVTDSIGTAIFVSIGTIHGGIEGKITSIERDAKRFVVLTREGASVSVEVDEGTKYLPEGKRWSDVKVGAKVSSTGHHPYKPPKASSE
jgi:hypothetical protein